MRRLEDEGFAVEPAELGCLYFETRGVERLYGGVAGVLERALAALGSAGTRAQAPPSAKFAALAAAAWRGRARRSSSRASGTQEFLAPLPLSLLPLDETRYAELEGLGDEDAWDSLRRFRAPRWRSAWDRTDGERGAWREEGTDVASGPAALRPRSPSGSSSARRSATS